MLPAMEVKNLVKSFGHGGGWTDCLGRASGEIHGLLGPTARETTLIRLITGLVKPAAG